MNVNYKNQCQKLEILRSDTIRINKTSYNIKFFKGITTNIRTLGNISNAEIIITTSPFDPKRPLSYLNSIRQSFETSNNLNTNN